tara:strand:- start:40 stop:537 length:498 start_codon:yes stop_codon:yes gene_type:complete
MEKEMFNNLFKYEDDKLFKKNKRNRQWICYNDLKPTKKGYIKIKLNGRLFMLHRVIYYFHNQEWDIYHSYLDNSIDHINENKTDNRIENLRVVNNSQNSQNKTHYGGKPVKGFCFCKSNNRWVGYCYVNKKRKSKSFKTETEALEYRTKMVELHYTHHPSKRPNQ